MERPAIETAKQVIEHVVQVIFPEPLWVQSEPIQLRTEDENGRGRKRTKGKGAGHGLAPGQPDDDVEVTAPPDGTEHAPPDGDEGEVGDWTSHPDAAAADSWTAPESAWSEPVTETWPDAEYTVGAV